jgi:hypothetical protein
LFPPIRPSTLRNVLALNRKNKQRHRCETKVLTSASEYSKMLFVVANCSKSTSLRLSNQKYITNCNSEPKTCSRNFKTISSFLGAFQNPGHTRAASPPNSNVRHRSRDIKLSPHEGRCASPPHRLRAAFPRKRPPTPYSPPSCSDAMEPSGGAVH